MGAGMGRGWGFGCVVVVALVFGGGVGAQEAKRQAEAAAPRVSASAAGVANRVIEGTKATPLTPEQRKKMLELLRGYDVEHAAIEEKRDPAIKFGSPESAEARKSGDKKRMFEIESKRTQYFEQFTALEDKYYNLIERRVLTEGQRPGVQAFRIYYRAVFPLNWVKVTREQGDKVKAMADEVVKEIKDTGDPEETYEKRLARLKERAREVLTEQQRAEFAKLEADFNAKLKGEMPAGQ